MPKFKYEPNKNKINNLSVKPQDEKEENSLVNKNNTRPSISSMRQVNSYPAKIENNSIQEPIKEELNNITPKKEPLLDNQNKDDFVPSNLLDTEDEIKNITEKESFKPNKKIILCYSVVLAAICLLVCVVKLTNKPIYTIDNQDLVATSVSDIEDGALIDIKNSVPLNLPIKDFNITVDEKLNQEKIETLLWDFTDTNENKVSIYIDGEEYKTIVLTKKPIKIEVPINAKMEIIQTETVNSPYTPYALKVNGITYFNRTSADKSNNYQFIQMKEVENLTLDDFNEINEEETE